MVSAAGGFGSRAGVAWFALYSSEANCNGNRMKSVVAGNSILRPGRLRFDDTIGIIAPASAPPDPQTVDRAAEALERFGFKPKPAKNLRSRLGFLAGTDRERATDLMQMFADKKVTAII